jgi:hypothetical protein
MRTAGECTYSTTARPERNGNAVYLHLLGDNRISSGV